MRAIEAELLLQYGHLALARHRRLHPMAGQLEQRPFLVFGRGAAHPTEVFLGVLLELLSVQGPGRIAGAGARSGL
jgi:hypothetical protein